MNSTLAGIMGLVGGILIGSAVTHHILTKKMDSRVDAEIVSFKQTYKAPPLTQKLQETDTVEVAIDGPEQIWIGGAEGITTPENVTKYHALVRNVTEEDVDVTAEEIDPEGYINPHDGADETEVAEAPKVITFDAYLNDEPDHGYPQITLNYVQKTDTVYTEDDQLIEDPVAILGKEPLVIRQMHGTQDSIFVINHARQTVFEVYFQDT